jgi:hypothetical protein
VILIGLRQGAIERRVLLLEGHLSGICRGDRQIAIFAITRVSDLS